MKQEQPHPSHELRDSDASSFDVVCTKCGQTDSLGTWGELTKPCNNYNRKTNKYLE